MNRINEFSNRLKFVRFKDLIQIFPALLAAIITPFFKLFHRNIWLVCERATDARDNGYWFYKYLCEQHPELEAVYAINFNAPDYSKVKSLGKVIPFGSLKHWIYYFSAERNISSQKEGKPNAALCFIIEVMLGRVRNRAYIRHGIVHNDQKWVYYQVTKMNLFVTSSKYEYKYVKEKFGYPEGYVQLVGLCRYDNLLSPHKTKRQLLIMPTMREWLRTISSDTLKYEESNEFEKSEYYITWTHLLASEKLHQLLEQYNVDLIFFPHASMQKYIGSFSNNCSRITIANAKNYDVQQLLMESAALITDYSSIFFDFGFLQKPLIYYQFDIEKFRRGHYQEGYFSHEDNGFGPVAYTESELIDNVEKVFVNDLQIQQVYKNRVIDFFAYHDSNNCERTFQAIKQMKCK